MKRRLKPRLHKRSPPPRTEENKIISTGLFQPAEAGFVCIDAVSTAGYYFPAGDMIINSPLAVRSNLIFSFS